MGGRLCAQEAKRGIGGDLELDEPGPPGVKPRSEDVSALGMAPTPADAELSSAAEPSSAVAQSPLEELPLNTNASDANPLLQSPKDPMSAERDLMDGEGLDGSALDPDDSALHEEEAAMLADLQDEEEPLDFEAEDDLGPQERSTSRRSQPISYVSSCVSALVCSKLASGFLVVCRPYLKPMMQTCCQTGRQLGTLRLAGTLCAAASIRWAHVGDAIKHRSCCTLPDTIRV